MNGAASWTPRTSEPVTSIEQLQSYKILRRAYSLFLAYAKFTKGRSPLSSMRVMQQIDEVNREAHLALVQDWTKHGQNFLTALGGPGNRDWKTVYGLYYWWATQPTSKLPEFLTFMDSKVRLFLAEVNIAVQSEERAEVMVDTIIEAQMRLAETTVDGVSMFPNLPVNTRTYG